MLQARQLGSELLVGVHSDESILENKGPTVMRLDERYVKKSLDGAGVQDADWTVSWPSKPAAGRLARSQRRHT